MIGQILRILMDQNGWTEVETSEKTSISQGNINRILNDPLVNPRRDTIEKIAKGFGIPVEELITGKKKTNTEELPFSILEIIELLKSGNLNEEDLNLVRQLITHLKK